MKAVEFGALTVGDIPRVVGTLSRLESLRNFPALADKPCDIAEVRLDLIGTETDWLPLCQSVAAAKFPFILTLRSNTEGGKWSGSDEQRLALVGSALPFVSAIDVEINSSGFKPLWRLASEHKRPIIASYHDFQQTPRHEDLVGVAQSASSADVVKISTMVNHPDDIRVLERLLAESETPLCVIGMGPLGTPTRTSFCTLGSCLTYGYVDSPAAPGQLSADALVSQLRQIHPRYNQDFMVRKQVLESV
jgi:3-dehydroquinate dehydratase-1